MLRGAVGPLAMSTGQRGKLARGEVIGGAELSQLVISVPLKLFYLAFKWHLKNIKAFIDVRFMSRDPNLKLSVGSMSWNGF